MGAEYRFVTNAQPLAAGITWSFLNPTGKSFVLLLFHLEGRLTAQYFSVLKVNCIRYVNPSDLPYSNFQGPWLGRYPRSGVSAALAFCASFLLLHAHYLPGALTPYCEWGDEEEEEVTH